MLNCFPVWQELGLKQPLHRKKLTLALQAIGSGEEGGWGQLDYTWVTCWLDDVGLPQYKETFHEARVDGRMLHYMTVDDLLLLKVTSQLHHVSIKRAIQVLRSHGFRPDCLHPHSCSVSNAQVMDWLHSVDLGEFASSLLGSGTHGGLLVLEPRFTIETLASLLSIPPSKSLLRRHLSTCLDMLVGSKAQALKQDIEDTPGATLLSISAKVKVSFLNQLYVGISKRDTFHRASQIELQEEKEKLEDVSPRVITKEFDVGLENIVTVLRTAMPH
uniref:SAM domain-containing protein n=1 Tax=Eptatretus burgeri TaxID=7764 RepID=A0A8C4QFL6_EPTBU